MTRRWRRILSETRRNLLRPGTMRIVLGVPAFMALMAWLGLSEEGLELPLSFTYHVLPLLMCPYAAHRVLADRDEGMHAVLATTPLSRPDGLAAKVLATFLVPVVAVGATLPILYGVAPRGAPGAFWTLLVHVPWALGLSWASASVGLVIGHLTPDHPRLGLGLAFGMVPLWFVSGVWLNDFQDPGLVVELLSKLSPVTYWDSMWVTAPIPSGPVEMLLGPLLLTLFALGLLVPISLGLQNVSGWSKPLGHHPLALAALAGVLILGSSALAVWEIPEDAREISFPLKGDQAGLHWSIHPSMVGFPFPAWDHETPVEVRVEVLGPPNATVHLEEVQITSSSITFDPEGPTDRVLVLERVFTDADRVWNETGGPVGFNSTTVQLTAHPTRLFTYAPARLTLQADGEAVTFDIGFFGLSWELDDSRIGAAAAVTLVPLAVVAWRLPPRWNRW